MDTSNDSIETDDKLVLFAFRKSQKVFFSKMAKVCKEKDFTIISAKRSLLFSLKSLKLLPQVDFQKACDFAVKEFYAKTNIAIPKCLLLFYFKAFSVLNFMRYAYILDKGYTKMLLWNGGKFRQLIALEVAKIKKIKVYFFENGLLPNTIVFDAKGINYKNSVPRDKIFYENYYSDILLPTSLVPRVGKNREVFKGEKEPLADKYIFVPFQVDYDTQIISQSPWIENMRMLFDVIEKIALKSTYHFVFKEHPSSGVVYDDLYQRAQAIENISFKNTYSTQELIEKSLAVITINSTVGIESLLFHKKVIVLGEAFYNIEDITYHADSNEGLSSLIEHIEEYPLNIHLIDNFLKYLYHEYLIPKNDKMYQIFCQRLYMKNVTVKKDTRVVV